MVVLSQFPHPPLPPPPHLGKVPIADSKQHPGDYNIRPASDYILTAPWNFWPKEFFDPKILWLEKFLTWKIFWPEKFLDPKIFFDPKKNFDSKEFFDLKKIFNPKIFFWPKKYFSAKKCFRPKIYIWPKEFLTQNFFSTSNFFLQLSFDWAGHNSVPACYMTLFKLG